MIGIVSLIFKTRAKSTHETVTPAVRERMSRIAIFVAVDLGLLV